jgi:hypothetical protein
MTADRVGRRGLAHMRAGLSERDLAIIIRLGELRLMTTRQLELLHFDAADFASDLSARRVARRVLERLARQRFLVRLSRRIGGVTAGSSGYIYALGPLGARILRAETGRRHYREPSERFVEHTLAISSQVVEFELAERHSRLEVIELQTEPRCWRQFGSFQGNYVLRPDLFVALGVRDLEHRLFIEVDLGTEHIPTLIRKCHLYVEYYRSGIEQAAHSVFPTVCWVVPTERRAELLERALTRTKGMVDGLFVLTTPEQALRSIAGGAA